jgi:chromosome segregation ATPase
MNSVQENKNELEAAVRYCESAISRAKATIESMEFRQQAASKAWHEQTGREAALEREVSELKQANMGLVCDNDDLKESVEDYKNENRELHRKIQTMEQTMQLQKDQIAMFQRKMSRMNEMEK